MKTAVTVLDSSPGIDRNILLQTIERLEPKTSVGTIYRSGDGLYSYQLTSQLANREIQVASLICIGLPNKQIAMHLGISVKTVESHRSSLKNKLNLHDGDLAYQLIRTYWYLKGSVSQEAVV